MRRATASLPPRVERLAQRPRRPSTRCRRPRRWPLQGRLGTWEGWPQSVRAGRGCGCRVARAPLAAMRSRRRAPYRATIRTRLSPHGRAPYRAHPVEFGAPFRAPPHARERTRAIQRNAAETAAHAGSSLPTPPTQPSDPPPARESVPRTALPRTALSQLPRSDPPRPSRPRRSAPRETKMEEGVTRSGAGAACSAYTQHPRPHPWLE